MLTEPQTIAKSKHSKNLAQKIAHFFLRIYQSWSQTRAPSCRFIPTCSQYCAEAIEMHGVMKGGLHTLKRLCKCHPLGPWGYDPPPSKK